MVNKLVTPAAVRKALCFHPTTRTLPQQLLSTTYYSHFTDNGTCNVSVSTYAVYIVCSTCGAYLGTGTRTDEYHLISHK